jgi:hypothetical protein
MARRPRATGTAWILRAERVDAVDRPGILVSAFRVVAAGPATDPGVVSGTPNIATRHSIKAVCVNCPQAAQAASLEFPTVRGVSQRSQMRRCEYYNRKQVAVIWAKMGVKKFAKVSSECGST